MAENSDAEMGEGQSQTELMLICKGCRRLRSAVVLFVLSLTSPFSLFSSLSPLLFSSHLWGDSVSSAVRAFRMGQLDEAAFQLERAEQDDPAIYRHDKEARRLRLFLDLATGRYDHFDRLAPPVEEADPMLAYLMMLRRLSLRDFDGAALLYPVILQGQSEAELRQKLAGRPPPVLPMPFACTDAMEAGWGLSDLRRIPQLYDELPGPVEFAAVFFLWKSRQSGWTGLFSLRSPELSLEELPALPEESEAFLSLILRPDKKKVFRCLSGLNQSASLRNSYRILFDLMMRIDDSPATYRQIAHRYLSELPSSERSAISVIEALHALRAGLDRLPPLNQVESFRLSRADRKHIEERLLLYRFLQQTYERLNRRSDAIQLSQIAAVLEDYLSSPRPFPRKELRDRTGENLDHREGLLLRLQLAREDEAVEIVRRIQLYDERHPDEHMMVFRTIYRYR
jgi:hypothetical protein